ncbi:MAG: hypothetical protein J6B10_06075 [Lachnospiraceae bacterium]|nr:hypothetical protein [Lachnospiraceae bacterium]
MKVELGKYRSSGAQVFSDRMKGIQARKELKLDDMDEREGKVCVVIPSDTWSINSSFFGGLFEGSLKKMNKTQFREKYEFIFNDGEKINSTLEENISDDIDYVLNNL